MKFQNANLLIEEADQLFDLAEEELTRAQEDVSSYLVCYNSRQAIVTYLSSFLLSRNIVLELPVHIQGLLDQCRIEDGRFDLLDISEISCNHDTTNEAYCLSTTKVSGCFKVAQLVKGFIKSTAPTY